MKGHQRFPKQYATGEDLGDKAYTFTIKGITQEKVYRPSEEKEVPAWVIYFEEPRKAFILGTTLWHEIATATGQDDDDHWAGQKVTLYAKARNVFGVRRMVVHARRANGGTPTPPPALVQDDDVVEDPDTF